MFDWLARKGEANAPARVPLAFLQDVRGRGADVPRSYEARVWAAMHENPVAARALRLVAEAVGAAPLVIEGGDGDVSALLSAPNPRASGSAFLERLAAHLVLHGNAYVEAAEGGTGKAAELYTLAPERVRIETDAQGWPAAFLYQTGTSEVRLSAPVDDAAGVLHLRSLSPCDDLYGLGALEAASGAVAAHNEAARWNRALLANSARPSGALVFEPKDGGHELSAEQLSRLRGELDEGFAGARRAGRPLLLEGGLKWQAMAMSPADMDFAAGQAAAARDIALALGVPPMLLGLPGDNTYANYAEANRALWRLTVLPLAGRICEALTEWLKFWWADAAVRVDLDKVHALSADRAEMWKRVSAADFLTADEKKRVLGIA
ncbi:phage portal protein [Pacificimonas sp. WHA3]|uniref:Phage portal protein n=1 Tax=Pacificimonas pallii TaxID=2827236 RepID=A0ABS6SAB8_9SPHN|nr:phage portal protein [Pacificimonas pallii]MBV7255216.1 phage portal protein [Pacificimonas pallii]